MSVRTIAGVVPCVEAVRRLRHRYSREWEIRCRVSETATVRGVLEQIQAHLPEAQLLHAVEYSPNRIERVFRLRLLV